jgi:hypothetical protein
MTAGSGRLTGAQGWVRGGGHGAALTQSVRWRTVRGAGIGVLLVLAACASKPAAPASGGAPQPLTAYQARFVGCWDVQAPLVDGRPWHLDLTAQVVGHVTRGLDTLPLRAAIPDSRAAALYRPGGWGRLYIIDSTTYYVTVGVSPPGSLELSLTAYPDSLTGSASRITSAPPYRAALGPARLIRGSCAR